MIATKIRKSVSFRKNQKYENEEVKQIVKLFEQIRDESTRKSIRRIIT